MAAGAAPKLLPLPRAARTNSASVFNAARSLAGAAAKAETREAATACASAGEAAAAALLSDDGVLPRAWAWAILTV